MPRMPALLVGLFFVDFISQISLLRLSLSGKTSNSHRQVPLTKFLYLHPSLTASNLICHQNPFRPTPLLPPQSPPLYQSKTPSSPPMVPLIDHLLSKSLVVRPGRLKVVMESRLIKRWKLPCRKRSAQTLIRTKERVTWISTWRIHTLQIRRN